MAGISVLRFLMEWHSARGLDIECLCIKGYVTSCNVVLLAYKERIFTTNQSACSQALSGYGIVNKYRLYLREVFD